MAGRALIASALLLLSCKRAPVEVVKKDPTPPVDAAPPESPARPGLAMLHGRLVDVRTGTVLHVLRPARPLGEAVLGNTAYTLDGDHTLRTWDVATGKQRADLRTASEVLVRVGDWVLLNGPADAHAFSVEGNEEHSSFPGTEECARAGGATVTRIGSRLLQLGSSARHLALADVEPLIESRRRALASREDSVCFAMFDPPNHRVECVDAAAKTVLSTVVALSKPTDVPGTRFLPRFISKHHIVIGTFSFGGFKSTRRAAVVRLSDSNVTIVEEEVAAAVERPDGTLEGLLVTEPELKFVSPTGALRWMEKRPRTDGFAAVALIDDRLVIALYNAIATGVDVFAVRVADGKPLWKGETKLPPIGHSKYRNLVTLETLGDAVILRGDESSVKHVHVYDSKTGALRFSDAQ